MQYDPIKKQLGNFFNRATFLRKLFYKLLDLLLLRAWHIHKELKKWERRKKHTNHILDAGAGFGQYTYYLSGLNRNWNILALDLKEEQVSDCNRFFNRIGRQNVVFRVGDLTKFVQKDSFDLILSVDVMEHIEADMDVFRNFHASLKPGGMLLISTPSDQGGSDVIHEGDTCFIEEHVRDGYNIEEIKNKLKLAGFENVYARYSYGTPGKLSWRLSMKYPMLMINASRIFFLILPFWYLLFYPLCFVLNWIDSRMVHDTGSGLIVKAWK